MRYFMNEGLVTIGIREKVTKSQPLKFKENQ